MTRPSLESLDDNKSLVRRPRCKQSNLSVSSEIKWTLLFGSSWCSSGYNHSTSYLLTHQLSVPPDCEITESPTRETTGHISDIWAQPVAQSLLSSRGSVAKPIGACTSAAHDSCMHLWTTTARLFPGLSQSVCALWSGKKERRTEIKTQSRTTDPVSLLWAIPWNTDVKHQWLHHIFYAPQALLSPFFFFFFFVNEH